MYAYVGVNFILIERLQAPPTQCQFISDAKFKNLRKEKIPVYGQVPAAILKIKLQSLKL